VRSCGDGAAIDEIGQLDGVRMGFVPCVSVKFPSRTLGVSLTAKVFLLARMLEIFAVPFAVEMLAKHPELRTWVTVSMTIIGTLQMLWGLLILLGVLFNW
jgi:hypothetical protein